MIANLKEEDNGTLDMLVENETDSNTKQGNSVVRNLNKDLDGHMIIPNPVKNTKSPKKTKLSTKSGSRNQPKFNVDLTTKSTQGPTRMVQGNKASSPSKNVTSSRDKGNVVVVAGPLKENKNQNNIVKNHQRDRGSVHKPNTPVPPARLGHDIQQQTASSGISIKELLRMMRYERQRLAEQGKDSLDDLPILRVHNDGF